MKKIPVVACRRKEPGAGFVECPFLKWNHVVLEWYCGLYEYRFRPLPEARHPKCRVVWVTVEEEGESDALPELPDICKMLDL